MSKVPSPRSQRENAAPAALSYRLDADDCISFVGDGWSDFATDNQAPEPTPDSVLGRSIWDFVAGPETRHLWEALFRRVRDRRTVTRIPFRCDAPDLRRFLEVEMTPGDDAVIEVSTRVLREESRPPVALLDSTIERSEDLLRMCSWCKSVETPRGWLEVEDAVTELGLFGEEQLPRLSHGMCPSCEAGLFEAEAVEAR